METERDEAARTRNHAEMERVCSKLHTINTPYPFNKQFKFGLTTL